MDVTPYISSDLIPLGDKFLDFLRLIFVYNADYSAAVFISPQTILRVQGLQMAIVVFHSVFLPFGLPLA